MQLSINKNELYNYVQKQMLCFFPDGGNIEGKDTEFAFEDALIRTEECFSVINNPAYSDEEGNVFFSHIHSDQYAQFLYFYSNSLWNASENRVICDKLIGLNRVLNNLFISYKCELPPHFFLAHAFGTIIGNAKYGDYLCVSHSVTINTGEKYNGVSTPDIGKGVWLSPGAKIIGNKRIGDRVSIGIDAIVYNQDIPDDMIVINRGNGTEIIKNKRECCKAQQYFRVTL